MPDRNLYQQFFNNLDFTPFFEKLPPVNEENTLYGPNQSCLLPDEFNYFANTHNLNKIFTCLHTNCRSITRIMIILSLL